jgi:uncharacterized protein (PEP-CTERM system associated)
MIMLAVGLAAGAPTIVHAQTWKITPAIAWESTWTDNVNLEPSSLKRSDWINQITPSVQFTWASAHTRAAGSIGLPVLLYARQTESSEVQPQVVVAGTWEAIERFFFIDASINVSQQFLSPFGATPNNLGNITNNRYTAQDYTISPYIRGRTGDGIEYELRDTNTWSNASQIQVEGVGQTGFTNEIRGFVGRTARPTGWSLEYDRTEVKFTSQDSEITEIARARALYGPDPTLQVSLIGGYENNRFAFTEEKGAVYGAGISWHPSERTQLDATLEHRFFGAGYNVVFNHRWPLSAFTISASRDTTSYPQQLANLPSGANVSQLLNSIFSSRIPNAAERQGVVDDIIRNRALPGTLSTPVVLFTEQITLLEQFSATYAILGARNGIFFTAFRSKDEPIGNRGDFVPPSVLEDINRNNTQIGANIAWNHQLTPTLTLGTNANWARTTSNETTSIKTRDFSVNGVLSAALTALTTAYGGVRYQEQNPNTGPGYTEFAVFVGLTHRFH